MIITNWQRRFEQIQMLVLFDQDLAVMYLIVKLSLLLDIAHLYVHVDIFAALHPRK